jgi:choline kinase
MVGCLVKDCDSNQVVILAAGIGSRLRPLTLVKPKPLIHVGGEAIIDRQINSFLTNGIKRITVIVGYRAINIIRYLSKKFPYPDCQINYIYNPIFAKTNTVYSLWLASFSFSSRTTFVANGDLILTPESISKMLSCGNSCLGLSQHKCGLEEVKVEVKNDLVVKIGKALDPLKVQGEYVGLAKFNKVFGQAYHGALDRTIKMGKINLYYDDVIQSLLSQYDIKTVNLTQDGIMEIDSFEDLENANKAFSSKAAIDSRVGIE